MQTMSQHKDQVRSINYEQFKWQKQAKTYQ